MIERNIVLTGFMGTGKTVTGRMLASVLNVDFIDTDAVIVERENMAVARIFQVKGEAYFRDVESVVIEEVSRRKGCVISTGGGAVIMEKNLLALKKNGIVICLTADPAIILLRTSSSKDRPLLLKSKDAIATIRHILKERRPYYLKADHTIDTSAHSTEDTVKAIMGIIKEDKDYAGDKDKA